MEAEYIAPTFQEIFDLSANMAEGILKQRLHIDAIVGISRGGLLPSRLLADFLCVNCLEIIKAELYSGPMARVERPVIVRPAHESIQSKRILLVDDVADSGDTIKECVDHLMSLGAAIVKTAVLYVKPWNKTYADIYGAETSSWIIFPWERMETLEKMLEKHGEEAYKLSNLPPKILETLIRIIDLKRRNHEEKSKG